MTITRELTLALNQHNQDVARARADYQAHPNRACGASGYGEYCHELRDGDRYFCDGRRVKRDLVNGARADRRAA